MTKQQQSKIYRAMNEAQKQRVADFIATGLNRNTAISSVVMQEALASKEPKNMVYYGKGGGQ